MARSPHLGDTGDFLKLTLYPDATFASEITALHNANGSTYIIGKLVQFVTSANFSVTSPADNALPDGEILDYEDDAINTWVLTCKIWGYTDVESAYKPAKYVKKLEYTGGTIALGQQVAVNGSTYKLVDGVNTAGIGKVIAKDAVSNYVHVII